MNNKMPRQILPFYPADWSRPASAATPGGSWPLAVLISLFLHGLLAWGVNPYPLPAPAREKAKVTRISFQREQPPPPAPVVEPPPRPVTAKPQPTRQPPPIPKPAPSKESPPPRPEPIAAEPRPVPVAAPSAPPAPPPATTTAQTEQIRQDYLARLMAHLEAHKFYPVAARRRGVEGTVQVSFMVMDNGEIRQLQLSGSHKLLHQAAAETVQRAVPMPSPPPEIAPPLPVSYGINFALR